jgi:NADPH:quinone reductase-like Zn-dependent oxidoreductase
VEYGHLHAGDTVLVQGTGGVALFGLQIAVAHGAEVVVTSGDGEKLERATALGAAHGVDRRSGDWVAGVLAATGGRGCDHVLDTVGGANVAASLRVAAVGGRVSLIGVMDGYELSGQIADAARKKLTIAGIQVGHRRALEELVRAVDAVHLTPVVAARYPMTDLPAALDHLHRGPFGKVVIDVGPGW